MKKKLLRLLCSIAVLSLAAILAWTFWPHTVESVIPGRTVSAASDAHIAKHTVEAIYDFNVDPAAYSAFHQTLGSYKLRADPRSLLPFFFRPEPQTDVCILVGRSETKPYFTAILWDGELLWVAVTPNHYLAYRPINTVSFQTALNRFVSEYEQ